MIVDPDPLTSPTRGVVTAEEAKERRSPNLEQMLATRMQTKDFKEGVTDYRQSPLFKKYFDDDYFRRSILNAKYIEHNIPLKEYYRFRSDNGIPIPEETLYEAAEKGQLINSELSVGNEEVLVTPENLDSSNVLSYMPVGSTQPLQLGSSSKEREDMIINERLKYLFNNPIANKTGDIYGFSLVDENNTRYVLPGFEETRKFLLEDATVPIEPAVKFDGLKPTERSDKDELRRYARLLKNMGVPETSIAEFIYAEKTGAMEQFRRKHTASDLIKIFPFIFRGVGEFTTDTLIDINNTFKEGLGDTFLGFDVAPQIDSSKNTFGKTTFGADILAEKSKGLLSVDDAGAILSYSPSFATSLQREGVAGALTYVFTGAAGVTTGLIKNYNFRKHIKDMFQVEGEAPISFDDALELAGKKDNKLKRRFTFNELFYDYYDKNHNSFLRDFRSNLTFYTMQMQQEARGVFAPKKTARYQLLDKRFLNENETLKNLIDKKAPKEAIDRQRLLVNRIERNRNFEVLRSFVPETFRNLAIEESGVTLGIASMNHLYQMNSVDPENTSPGFFMTLLGAMAGTYSADKVTGGAVNLVSFVSDFGKALVRDPEMQGMGFLKYRNAKSKAKNVFTWMARAEQPIQQEMLASLESHKILAEELMTINIGDTNIPILSNPEALYKSIYQIVGLNHLQVVGDQLQDIVAHSDVRNLSSEFQELLKNQKQQVILYNDLADAMTALRKARLHPNIEANEAARNLLDVYLGAYDQLGKKLGKFDENLDKASEKLKDDVTQMINGFQEVDPKNIKKIEKLKYDYDTSLRVFSDIQMNKLIREGYKPLEALKIVNGKLSEFDEQLKLAANRVDSIKATNEQVNNAAFGNFSSIKNIFNNRRDALFTELGLKYGKDSKNPVYADGTEFYRVVSKYDSPDFDEYFEAGEQFLKDIGKKGSRDLKKINLGVAKRAFMSLYEDAATVYLKPENVKKYDPNIQAAINAIKKDKKFASASDFQIWKELDRRNIDVRLPIDFEDWKLVASAMSSKAYGFMGKEQGKVTKDLYDQWVEMAEDEVTGFSTNFFDPKLKAPIGENIVKEWKVAKGSHHAFAARYKHKLGKKWGAIEGTTETGSLILKESPSTWLSGIIKEFSKGKISQERLDEIVSELAQATGGINVGGKNQIATYSFASNLPDGIEKTANDKGMMLIQKLFNRAGKLYLLASPTGQTLTKELLKKKILPPNALADLKADPNYSIFLDNIARLKTHDGKALVNMEEVRDGVDSRKLFELMDDWRATAEKTGDDILKRTEEFVKEKKLLGKTALGKVSATKIFLENNLTPQSIFKIISEEGAVGLQRLDAKRNDYKALILNKLGITEVSPRSLMVNEMKLFEQKMKEWDKGIAGLYLEYLDKATKQRNPAGTVKMTKDHATKEIDLETEDMVDGDLFLKILGKNTTYEKTVKEILDRGDTRIPGSNTQRSLYDQLLVIGGYMSGEKLSRGGTFKLEGTPRSLSFNSWMSRAYAYQRGVIGPQWIIGEALFHTMKKNNFNIFKEMMENPDISRIAVQMLEEGRPPKGDQSVIWTRALINGIARERAGGYFDEEGNESSLSEIEKRSKSKLRQDIDAQMKDIRSKTITGPPLDATGEFLGRTFDKVKNFLP